MNIKYQETQEIKKLKAQCVSRCNQKLHQRVPGNYIIKVGACFWDFESLEQLCGSKINQNNFRYHDYSQYERHDIVKKVGPVINGYCYYHDIKLIRPCYNCYLIYQEYLDKIISEVKKQRTQTKSQSK